ncbi:protein ANTAGONIST OF LIKE HETEROCHROMATIN PROTEIN 1-like [Gouania willdenowi]|uniref:Protein ANTAGONIST OF LIKE HETEROCHROMATIN PROTEIN 1-like n=1 Tax=Gouania willdenowi TaxID=441366 RepID=A0A8C5DNT7_GOUWI|nr:protein ANTAGONIST OF LIKE HETEROCHROMATIN PROTEIN 1-like [Gouania willdenowi]
MEHQQIAVLLACLLALWRVHQNILAQEAVRLELEMRRRAMQCFLQMRRMVARRKRRRRRERENELLLFLRKRRSRIIWAQPRPTCWWEHITDTWDDLEWQKNFRMKRKSFEDLCDILSPSLTRCHTNYRLPVPPELKVALCLWRLATNVEFRSISHLFGVGLSTACSIVQEVVTAINCLMKDQYIRTPSEADFRNIVHGFRDKWKFPQVVGAIDATHISIRAPADDADEYHNRKGFYSILLQAVVDHDLKFWNINIGWPGKVHDARAFANSSLYQRAQSGTLLPNWTETFEGVDVPLLILGDAAYPLLPWLLKPYPEGRGATQAQTAFNHRLNEARMTVQKAFGRLKSRWKCLLKRCDAHITFVSYIVSACCVLHNYCESRNETWEEENPDTEHQDDDRITHDNLQRAGPEVQIRDALSHYFLH